MRILLVTNYQPPHMGGIEYAAAALKECWLKLGHEVVWLTTDIPPGAFPRSKNNVRVPAANFPERKWQINTPLINPFCLPLINRALNACDVVNVHSLAPGLASFVMFLALRRRKPAVATQHVGVIPLANKMLDIFQKSFLCATAKWGTGKGMKLTFVGEAVRQWFLDNAGIRPEQTVMTPAGIDHNVFFFAADEERRRFRAKWRLDDKALNVLFVGRFYEKKGLPLIRQMAETSQEIRFTLVGQGPISPASWGLPNLRLIAYVSSAELRELYGAHDLFIMPSIGEGWPAVIPQAMACGLPCLISEETFLGYGKDRERFIICRRDAAALKKAVLQFAAGTPLPDEQRFGLAKYARAQWDWERTAGIYLELFEKSLQIN
ncbi:MAG: glycosyltransferase family 4 protein [Kiritimatiellae bacterium]|nr:glycosyltransferase family 4 protein [Kiritimatiellia bacterium]